MLDGTWWVNQLLLLLVCIPLCGILTIGLIAAIGREHLPRTFLLNGLLTFGCALAVVFQFQSGREQNRLSPADSFQMVIEFSRPGSMTGFRFGVDGCSLLPILFASALPLLVISAWNLPEAKGRENATRQNAGLTCGQAAIVLLLQALILTFLTALDRRVQIVTLLGSTCVLSVGLSISSPAGRRNLLQRWQSQTLMSDFLIAGGMLGTLMPLVQLAGLEYASGGVFDLRRLLAAIEMLREEELVQYVRLMSAVVPATVVLLAGCSIRFGMFPFSRAARTMWKETAPWQRLLIWAHAPLLGTAIVLRELQLYSLAVYQVVAWLRYFWLLGLFLCAIVVRLSTGNAREAARLVYFSSFLLFSLAGPNAVSLAGSFLLLPAIGLHLSIVSGVSSEGSVIRFLRGTSCFLVSAGVICTLLGYWQGSGAGSRGLALSLATGLSVLILGTAGRGQPRRMQGTGSSLLFRPPRSPAQVSGERPVWDISPPAASVPALNRRQAAIRSAGLVLAVCVLLVLPNFFWQRVRRELQKIEFPRRELAVSVREDRP